MNLYMLRHGESVGNSTGNYSTIAHDALSAKGVEQALQATKLLRQFCFDAIYCSPLQRAIQTIVPYARLVKQKAEVWPELAEACWQEVAHYTSNEQIELEPCDNFPEYSDCLYFREHDAFRPSEKETYAQGICRINKSINMLFDRHMGTDDNVLIVAHGHLISRLIQILLGLELVGEVGFVNAGLTYLSSTEEGFEVVFKNLVNQFDKP